MELGEIDIEEVLEKWEKHHPPPEKKITDEKPWYQQPLSAYSNVNQRRRDRRRVLKKVTPDYINEGHYIQKRFRVIPPKLNIDIQNYQISQCNKCQSSLQYFPLISKDTKNNQTLSLFDCVAAKKNLQWYGARYFRSVLLDACYQSKDEVLIKQVNQKQTPVLLVHNTSGLFSSMLLHLYCASFGKVPYTIIEDEDVSSSILKYFMKKVGFLFIKKDINGEENKSIADMIINLLKSNNHVLISVDESEPCSSISGRLFPVVLDALRTEDQIVKQVLLLPVALSIEAGYTFFQSYSLIGLLKNIIYFLGQHCSLAHFNVSRSIKLQSVMMLASELNEQDNNDEENNLVLRHISFDLLEIGVVLPSHLVSFLFLTKYRDSVCIDELNETLEWLISELRHIGRFIGFSGNTADITNHAINILMSDDVLEINIESKVITPKTGSCVAVKKLFENAKKIIQVFMTKAILASSIVACLGGRQELMQGSGYNVKCCGEKLLEKAEYLAEMLSFLFDFCCPFNKITEDLVDSLEKMVTMDILHTYSDTYESQSHQKLVHSIAIDSVWDEEEYAACNGESEVMYDLSLHDDVIQLLSFLRSCILPFIEITFTVVALIRELKGDPFSVKSIYESVVNRFENGFVMYGEMVTLNYVSRIFDFLYEKEIIDEHVDGFILSEFYSTGNGAMEKLLADISLFR